MVFLKKLISELHDDWNAIKKYLYDVKLLVLFLLTDFIFIVLHVFHRFTDLLPGIQYNLEFDGGYAETFQYVKEFWIILLLIDLTIRRRKILYLAWCLLFSYLMLDDIFQLHETIGGTFVKPLLIDLFHRESRFGVNFKDYGELIVSIFFGSFLLIFIAISHYKSESKEKLISTSLFILIALLAFFGIAIDMAHEHVWIERVAYLNRAVFGLIEDAGEMIIMSGIIWFVYCMSHAFGSIPSNHPLSKT